MGGLHDLREADKSIAVDKVAQKPPTEPFSKDTCELEEALSKHAHAALVRTLGRIKDCNVWVVEADEGKATKFAVRHKKAPMQTHSAFTAFHRTRCVDVNVCPTTHEERLKCTCPWTRMMGLPCAHICAVNNGASMGDVAVRWLNAMSRGVLDEVVFEHEHQFHHGAEKMGAADSWSVSALRVSGSGSAECGMAAGTRCCHASMLHKRAFNVLAFTCWLAMGCWLATGLAMGVIG